MEIREKRINETNRASARPLLLRSKMKRGVKSVSLALQSANAGFINWLLIRPTTSTTYSMCWTNERPVVCDKKLDFSTYDNALFEIPVDRRPYPSLNPTQKASINTRPLYDFFNLFESNAFYQYLVLHKQ